MRIDIKAESVSHDTADSNAPYNVKIERITKRELESAIKALTYSASAKFPTGVLATLLESALESADEDAYNGD